MQITVPGGQDIEYAGEGRLKDILVEQNKALLKEFIAARLGDMRIDFHTQLEADARVELISWDDPEAAWIYRHSLSHVLAQAVLRLFPEAQLAIGQLLKTASITTLSRKTTPPEDLSKIEREMKRVISRPQVRTDRRLASRSTGHDRLGHLQRMLDDLEEVNSSLSTRTVVWTMPRPSC